MTQRQITHDFDLPTCSAGHAARHILDHRGMSAGGGHFIECSCRKTTRHAELDPALAEWCRLNDKRKPRIPRGSCSVVQLRLPMQRGLSA